MEIWKDIPNYEGYYQVSDLGNVKSLDRKVINSPNGGCFTRKGKKLKPIKKGKQNYLVVSLNKKGRGKMFTIHQLVAITFLNHKPCGFDIVVDHKNNISTDNNLSNIQLVSNRYNSSKDKVQKSGEYCIYKIGAKFMVRLRVNGVKKSLGTYSNIDKAKTVRDDFFMKEANLKLGNGKSTPTQ